MLNFRYFFIIIIIPFFAQNRVQNIDRGYYKSGGARGYKTHGHVILMCINPLSAE